MAVRPIHAQVPRKPRIERQDAAPVYLTHCLNLIR
jgi:hypothetical protein